RWADVFCLHPAGGLRRRRGGVANDEQRRAESARLHALRERMLARMAFCVRVEPALLRALRGAGAASAAEPALEALLWTHQPVVGDSHVSRALTPAYLESYRQAFQALPAAEQVQALAAARQVHAWRGRATEAAEASIWQAHACAEAQDECGDRVEEARQWFAALTARATRGSTADAGLRDYARDLLARNGADRRWVAANSAWLSPVWLASGAVAAPSGLRDEDLAQAVAARSDLPELDCRLGVGAQGLLLWRGELPPGPGHSPIGPPLRVKRLQVSDADGPRLLDPAAAPQCVAPLASLAAAGAGLTLFAGRHAWRVAGIERPAWAHEIGRDACGLYADLLVPLPGAAPDDPQAIRQRCRWIEAGHFRMGSPADEPAHLENEAQHEVTLSRGFWLADTACTQALWQAVTGANPSEFQDDVRNPVENVSWRDVQAFLSELNRRMPGLQARLPSEAEWEYACRAGTTTPFSFGDDISPEQVNYNGDSPYAGGEKGLNREKTVPVGSLPANPWGLYEMHGNVWEWCADWYGDYPTAP
ncbi:MAG: formylglycine-generating enzyme family protein, partial [Candidatus Accumulibacter phosphatis]